MKDFLAIVDVGIFTLGVWYILRGLYKGIRGRFFK